MTDRGGYLESVEEIPEPHAFTAHVRMGQQDYPVVFEEHEHAHASAHRDNNMRAAIIHVMADAAVSVLVIIGLLLARAFGWLWMDPLAGIVGAAVIASWSYGLIRDTGAILLDMNPDHAWQTICARPLRARATSLPICISGAWAPGIWARLFQSLRPSPRRRLLSRQACPLQIALTSHRRGFAQILIVARPAPSASALVCSLVICKLTKRPEKQKPGDHLEWPPLLSLRLLVRHS